MRMFGFKSGGLKRNIFIILTGSILAQIITALTLPLVTRLYGSEIFGSVSILVSSVSILASVGALSIDLTIPLPNSDVEARRNLDVVSSVVVGMGFFIFTLTYPLIVISRHFEKYISQVSLMLCYLLLVMQVISAATILFLTRRKQFKRIQIALVTSQILQVSVHILVGMRYPRLENLLLGYLASLVLSTVLMLNGAPSFAKPSVVMRTLQRYRSYVILTTSGSFLNVLSSQATMLSVACFISVRGAGYIALVNLVLGRPLSLISQSSIQGLLGEWSSGIAKDPSLIRRQALHTSFKIFAFGTLAMTCTTLFFYRFPATIFGNEWKDLWKYLLFYGLAHVLSATVNPLAWLPELFERTDLTLSRSLWRLVTIAVVTAPVCYFFSGDAEILFGLCIASVTGSFIFGKICLTTIPDCEFKNFSSQ